RRRTFPGAADPGGGAVSDGGAGGGRRDGVAGRRGAEPERTGGRRAAGGAGGGRRDGVAGRRGAEPERTGGRRAADDLTRMAAGELAEAIGTVAVSAVEVTRAHLDRIDAVDGVVH